MVQGKNKMAKVIIVVLLIIVVLMGGTLIYLNINKDKISKKGLKNNTKIEENTNKEKETKFSIPEGATIGTVNTTDNINFDLDISQYKPNDIVYYRLNNDYVVSLNFYDVTNSNINSNFKNFSISINGVLADIDSGSFDSKGSLATDAQTIAVSLLGDNLIFNNYFWTDIRSISVYVISLKNNVSRKIGEMESIQGMVPKSSQIVTKEGLSIIGSRETHGPGVAYGGNNFYICDDSVNSIPTDAIMSAKYFYKFDGEKLDIENPQKTDIVTVGEYINNSENRSHC